MCGNTFKHNLNRFCYGKKHVIINVMYEHKYSSIFIISSLLLMLMTTGYIYKTCWVSVNNNQTNHFGKVYHFTFWLQHTNMNSSRHCRTSNFEEEFKLQYVRGDVHIHIFTQSMILAFFFKVEICMAIKKMEMFTLHLDQKCSNY